MARTAFNLSAGTTVKKSPFHKLLDWVKPISIALLWIAISFFLLIAFAMDYQPITVA